MKGIILAGGSGTRLNPLTKSINKHLLPIYNKPMIYYPLSILMLSKIRNILIITNSSDLYMFKKLLGNGKNLGININYKIQKKANGIAEALKIGKKFVGKDDVMLILGDNIIFGDNLKNELQEAIDEVENNNIAVNFSYNVANPSGYGIVKYKRNKIFRIIEKPKKFISNDAIIGLYIYPNNSIKLVDKIKFSKRKELEITDLNNLYAKKNQLKLIKLGRGSAWFDAGTFENLFEASQLIRIIEKRVGLQIGSLEEISKNNNWL